MKSRSKLKFLLIPLGVFALVSIYITLVTERQRTYTYRFNDYTDIVIPVEQDAIDHGRHLFVTRGCVDCHDMDAGGSVIRDGWFSGTIVAPNLTRGEGGIGGLRTPAEMIRAFREGVKHDSTSVLFMPAHVWGVMDMRLRVGKSREFRRPGRLRLR